MAELHGLVERLPHGPKARMISDVLAHGPSGIETEMQWVPEDDRIVDHFPGGRKVVPGVFLAEQIAQSALLMALLEQAGSADVLFVLGHIRCDFQKPALAPCTVFARTVITAQLRESIGFQGECFVDGIRIARIKGVASRSQDVP